MDIHQITLFYDVCRLCLDKRGVHCMFENNELPDDIFACTGVRVKSTDNLPRTICDECLETIKKAKELRKLALSNEQHLRILFDDELNDSDNDDGSGRLVIDESRDAKEETTQIVTVNNDAGDDRIMDVSLDVERLSPIPVKKKKIDVRKDLFSTSKPDESPVTSSSEQTKVSPKKDRKSEVPPKRDKDIAKIRKNNAEEYTCPTCGKQFSHYKKLYLHQRLHNKSIACDVCQKMFATKGDLQKHIRVHTGERPFVCSICDKRFTQRVTLKQHREAVHSGSASDDDQ